MAYQIQPKKITVSGYALLMKPLSRRAAVDFREAMKAAGDDLDQSERIGLDLIAANVTFADGTPLDVDEVPQGDLVEIIQRLLGSDPKGVSDFTRTP